MHSYTDATKYIYDIITKHMHPTHASVVYMQHKLY